MIIYYFLFFCKILFDLYLLNAGPEQLLQFTVDESYFENRANRTDKLISVFTLHRIPSYLIINAYVPSLCIMAMTIVPLYLRYLCNMSFPRLTIQKPGKTI